MGRLIRGAAAGIAAVAIGLIVAGQAAAFDGFGEATADSTYDVEIQFDVELTGSDPDRLEIMLAHARWRGLVRDSRRAKG